MAYTNSARSAPTLDALAATARKILGQVYGGDVSPEEACRYLEAGGGMLVDVRTPQEWKGGVPDVSRTRGALVTLAWKTLPDYALNPDFIPALTAQPGIGRDTPLFFICHSGGRSLDAAIAMTAQGYRHCFNVTGGFEGWKATQLPSKQGN